MLGVLFVIGLFAPDVPEPEESSALPPAPPWWDRGGSSNAIAVDHDPPDSSVNLEQAMLNAYGPPNNLEREILGESVIPCMAAAVDRNWDRSSGISKTGFAAMLMGMQPRQNESAVRALRDVVGSIDADARETIHASWLSNCLSSAR